MTPQNTAATAVGQQRLVGRFGKFSDSKGVTHACRVVREEGDILQVNYVPTRNVVSAWIDRSAFSPNDPSAGTAD